MKPVDQTQFYVKGISHGNCLQAAVASLLELSLEEVPNFIEQKHFWGSFRNFLKSKGYNLERIKLEDNPEEYYLVFGWSSRQVLHAVIYCGDKLAHDPHPSREGVLEITEKNKLIKVNE